MLLIGTLIYGWQKIPVFLLKELPPETKFSIVIPYRNEAENLPLILNSILELNYPSSHFELLLIDDSSTDTSTEICAGYKKLHPHLSFVLLKNERKTGSPKKDAITTAVDHAVYPYIITTDADCFPPPFWLQAYNEKIKKTNPKLIAGPVVMANHTTLENSSFTQENRERKSRKYLNAFQEMDFLSLQAAGAGGFGINKAFMGNGANLCYSRASFLEVGGFTGNGEVTSGDDVFLIQKFEEKRLKTEFLKCREAIVHTKPQPDIASLFSQRVRWAAKTPAYKSNFAQCTGLTVLLMNFSLVAGCVLVFFEILSYRPVLFAFLFKFLIDLLLLYRSADFFDRKENLRNYFWSSLLYPFFSSSVAIMSLFRNIEWKGRVSRK